MKHFITFAVWVALWMIVADITKTLQIHTYFTGALVAIGLVRITDAVWDYLDD